MKKSKSQKGASENGSAANDSANKKSHEDFLVVGIGASACGVQALKESV